MYLPTYNILNSNVANFFLMFLLFPFHTEKKSNQTQHKVIIIFTSISLQSHTGQTNINMKHMLYSTW